MTEKETIGENREITFISEATEQDGIYLDLTSVAARMFENEPSERVLLIYTNATNGYLELNWFDLQSNQTTGQFIYWLQLLKLWQLSLDHAQGAFFFENETHIGICMLTEDLLENGYKVYILNEYQSQPEILIV